MCKSFRRLPRIKDISKMDIYALLSFLQQGFLNNISLLLKFGLNQNPFYGKIIQEDENGKGRIKATYSTRDF